MKLYVKAAKHDEARAYPEYLDELYPSNNPIVHRSYYTDGRVNDEELSPQQVVDAIIDKVNRIAGPIDYTYLSNILHNGGIGVLHGKKNKARSSRITNIDPEYLRQIYEADTQ